MAAALDSPALFRERMSNLGITPEQQENFEQRGWNTFGEFAFSTAYQPGGGDENVFVRDVLVPILGADSADHRQVPAVRRLFFESFTMVAADMKARVERTDEDQPRKLPALEVEVRRRRLQQRLGGGIDFVGELEPSYQLVNSCNQMYEDNVLKYISWEFCTKRYDELHGVKRDKTWVADANGLIKVKDGEQRLLANTGTDLLMRYALQRRGVALDMANLLSYEVHEELIARLIREYMTPVPAFYRPLPIEQLQRADAELWRLALEATRDGIRGLPGNALPLDQAFHVGMADSRFSLVLMPMPAGGSRNFGGDATSTAAHQADSGSLNNKKRKGKHQRQAAKIKELTRDKTEQSRSEEKTPKRQRVEAPYQASKSTEPEPRMPLQLRGKSSKDPHGRYICFSYNIDGCSKAKDGEKCPKGFHVCCEPGCGKAHPISKHQ